MLAWSGAWVVMGLAVADEVRGLQKLSDTVVAVGQAAEGTAATLRTLQELPLVGEQVRGPAQQVQEAGRSAIESGRASRESAQNLSVLLGITIAVIPSTPLMFLLLLRFAGRPDRGVDTSTA